MQLWLGGGFPMGKCCMGCEEPLFAFGAQPSPDGSVDPRGALMAEPTQPVLNRRRSKYCMLLAGYQVHSSCQPKLFPAVGPAASRAAPKGSEMWER